MNATCPTCQTIFRVDPAKVPVGGLRARCSVCRAVFPISADGAAAAAVTPAPLAETVPFSVPRMTPPAPPPAAPPSRAAPPAPPPMVAPPVAAPRFAAPGLAPPMPAAPPRPAAPAAPARPMMPPPFAPPAAAPAPPPMAAAPPVAPAAAMPVPPPVPPPAPAAPRTTLGGTPGRVINPFLVQDPQVKARRLARALISDMISYHPAKRAQGLKEGTLKAHFEEEIKKSYEEYALQVGADVAKNSTHFTDALNEILAGGQKIF